MPRASKQVTWDPAVEETEKPLFSTHRIPDTSHSHKDEIDLNPDKLDMNAEFEWKVKHLGDEGGHYDDDLNEEILDYLESLDLISPEDRAKVEQHHHDNGSNIADAIVQLGIMKRANIGIALADYFNTAYVDLKNKRVAPADAKLIPESVAKSEGAIVYDLDDSTVWVAAVNPSDQHFLHLLEKKANKKVKMKYSTPAEIAEAQRIYQQDTLNNFQNLISRVKDDITQLESLNSISNIFDTIILMAYYKDASDIHIEPFEDEIRIRLRIDGVLSNVAKLPVHFLETMVNHVKVLAKLRTDEHSSAQDGRFKMTFDETVINFRVSILPSYYGEKMVFRLLSSESQEVSLEELGYSKKDIEAIERHVHKTQGLNLVTGPTGSGKTTSLYSILTELNQEDVNISTIEDPIEYGLYGMNQVQVNPKTNLTFADGLRSLLRQDPDIMMIGEVRDLETAKIATHASLTGHLILATLHTSNAALAPLRLVQMGLDPYMIVSTLNLIVAQRLVRTICKSCMGTYNLTRAEIKALGDKYFNTEDEKALFERYFTVEKGKRLRLYKGNGCDQCGNSGYRGRTVVAEVMEMNTTIRDMIVDRVSQEQLQAEAIKNGMTTILEDGLTKVFSGDTTLDELFRVLNQ